MNTSKLSIDVDLDSFLDILTNVIGVMVLVATVIALQLQQTTTVDLGRPLLHDPPQDAKRVWVECRQGRFFEPPLAESREIAVDKAIKKFGSNTSWSQVLDFANSLKLGDENYSVVFENAPSGHPWMRAAFKPDATGGYHADAKNENQDFKKWLLANYDPKKHWLMVKLHRNGFESFAECREIATELGFEVGWYLSPDEQPTICYLGSSPPGSHCVYQVD